MIEEQTFVVNDSISNGIICALERLKEFFSQTKKIENLTFEDILSIKASAVRLAYAIYMKNNREGVKQDNILEEWHKISQNKNEFSDVRKQWGLIPEGIISTEKE